LFFCDNDSNRQAFLYAIHLEVFWWIETNVTEYIHYRNFVLPEWDSDSMGSPLAWKLYYIELKERILPPLIRYQGSLALVHGIRNLLSHTVSKQTMLRLNQHPPRRAIAIAERESDRLQVGMEVFVASLWANIIFFVANYTAEQIGVFWDYYRKQAQARSRQVPYSADKKEKDVAFLLLNKSWSLLVGNARRLFYSAVGAGLGSIVLPGWGTLFGIGIGDEWARNNQQQADSDRPKKALIVIHKAFKGLVGTVSRIRFPLGFSSLDDQTTIDDQGENIEKQALLEDLICGCCQTNVFSSNPTSRECAPISSRACSHTICKSCVQKCHNASMERFTNNSLNDEWIKCPLCNAVNAFSSHDPLVNRSLCAAIATIEAGQCRALEKATV
jgi:hypothetical protein